MSSQDKSWKFWIVTWGKRKNTANTAFSDSGQESIKNTFARSLFYIAHDPDSAIVLATLSALCFHPPLKHEPEAVQVLQAKLSDKRLIILLVLERAHKESIVTQSVYLLDTLFGFASKLPQKLFDSSCTSQNQQNPKLSLWVLRAHKESIVTQSVYLLDRLTHFAFNRDSKAFRFP